MIRPGIEPRSPGPLANTQTARPMSGSYIIKSENFDHRIYKVMKQFFLSW